MKRTRTGRLARLWAVLPDVGKHIAERFSVRRARLYVLKGGETGFALHSLCSITFTVDTDPSYAVEWIMQEDYEDANARDADPHETGRMSVTLRHDGAFSVPSADWLYEWRDGLERWRDPVPTPQEASLADFADVTSNPDYTAEDALEFMRKVRAGELER